MRASDILTDSRFFIELDGAAGVWVLASTCRGRSVVRQRQLRHAARPFWMRYFRRPPENIKARLKRTSGGL
jgi:hypothetical protein